MGDANSAKTTKLKPTESAVNKAVVFWNNKPDFSPSFPNDVAERASAGRILTDYVFPEVGSYYVKAAYSIHLAGQSEAVRIESVPIKISITERVGENLEVWNRRNSGDFAFFMQEGDFSVPTLDASEKAKLREEIEQIIREYPNSVIVRRMKKRIENLRASEKKQSPSARDRAIENESRVLNSAVATAGG